MPLVKSNFKAHFGFRSGFIATVYSGLIRRLKIKQFRERITLRDDDFIDLDWSYSPKPSKSVIILFHGLEGHGQRPYITGAALHFNEQNIDAICVNFRCCSGELNKYYTSYHSGKTDDIEDIVKHVVSLDKYDSIFLKGISLGGNILLKYLGDGSVVPPQVKAAMAVSVPCDLSGSAKALHALKNLPYHINFKWGLIHRLKLKQKQFPEAITKAKIRRIKTLNDFDEVYTSRAHGFENAQDYYAKCSSLQFLDAIKTPVLILNALNDSFLSEACFPFEVAEKNPNVYLETPNRGGHVGFISRKGYYYNETRALEFFLETK
ncbi:alpha/beta hydrolase [Flavobacteriaceae bacterium]|nr:alpha/beta hydrolase [Flavobacteriaceae bacterium]MDA9970284.1 alpha/beta hydrolase [Flavobacteriaceae bacterium]MDB4289578.1 alpha/beta hydrolase [Flavobacteriaceae bacterium]